MRSKRCIMLKLKKADRDDCCVLDSYEKIKIRNKT